MGESPFFTQMKDLIAILGGIADDYTPGKAKKMIRLAVLSLMRHKMRSALSILGVICGVIAVLAMLSIGEGAKQEAMKQIEQLGIHNMYVRAITLTEEQRARSREKLSRGVTVYDGGRILGGVGAVGDVAAVREVAAPVLGMTREVMSQIIAVSENYARVQNLPLLQGRFLSGEDTVRNSFVCVIGDGVAARLGQQGSVGSSLRIDDSLFRIVGILKRVDVRTAKSSVVSARNYNEMIIIPLGTERWISASQTAARLTGDGVDELIVRVKDGEDVLQTANAVKRILELTHHAVIDYQLVIPQELLAQAKKTQRTFNIVLGAIAGISLLVGGIGIMNIMLATVTERTREIGIRRAVGATREHIIVQFLAEAVVLTASGGVVGLLCGVVTVFIITSLSGWQTSITFLSLILSLVMSVMVGIFFGLYPAYQASQMDPIEALRNE